MNRSRRVKNAAGDVRLASARVEAAISHLTSALHSHVPLPPKLAARVRALRATFGPLRHDLAVLAVDVELAELRAKRERRRQQVTRRAA
jgi:hypothetical protein